MGSFSPWMGLPFIVFNFVIIIIIIIIMIVITIISSISIIDSWLLFS